MGLYSERILPHLINCACGAPPVSKQRQKIVPHARGEVLEVGLGSGLNLPHYSAGQVKSIRGLEPSLAMRRRAANRLDAIDIPVEWLDLADDRIPLDDASVDTVVVTYTLCTIADVHTALAEMRRVLRRDGRMLFCEHGEAPDPQVRRWQDRLNPLWSAIGGGCQLNRRIPQLIEDAGFAIHKLETMYLPRSPKFAGFNYWGQATKA